MRLFVPVVVAMVVMTMAGNTSALGTVVMTVMVLVMVAMRNLPVSLAVADNAVNDICDHILDVFISPAVVA